MPRETEEERRERKREEARRERKEAERKERRREESRSKERRRDDDRGRRPSREEIPVVVAGTVPAVVNRPTDLVVKTTVVKTPAGYPNIEGSKNDAGSPSAPPRTTDDRRDEEDRERRRRERHRQREERESRSSPNSREKRVGPRERERRDVSRIRDIEGRGADSTDARASVKVSEKKRRDSNRARRAREAEKMRSYPHRVDWFNPKERLSMASILTIGSIIAIVTVMIIANLAITVKMPKGTDVQTSTFVYNNVSSTYWTYQEASEADTSVVPSQHAADLIIQLLNLPNLPEFNCTSESISETDFIMAANGSNDQYVSFGYNNMDYFGDECSNLTTRLGYCLQPEACANAYQFGGSTVYAGDSCISPPGPRRNGFVFIADSFVETVMVAWYIPLMCVGGAFLFGFIWLLIAILFPTISSFVLVIAGIMGSVIVYIGWATGLKEGLTEYTSNFYILIYASFLLFFFVLGTKFLTRVGNILRIGSFILSGVAVDGFKENASQRELVSVAGPVAILAGIQTTYSILLVFSAAAAPRVVELVYDSVTVDYYGMEVQKDGKAPVWDDQSVKGLSCEYEDWLPLNSSTIVFSIFYLFGCIFFQYAARFLVSCATADWYYMGTKAHKPLPDGPSFAWILGLKRALLRGGGKIMRNGLVAYFGTTAVSVHKGIFGFIVHSLLAPVDCLFYSPLGFILSAFSRLHNRFALTHASMYGGPFPTIAQANKMSTDLVSKMFGRAYCQVGDSPEVKVLSFGGNLVSLAFGFAAWLAMDFEQDFDSVSYMGGYAFLLMWLVGSAIQRPGIVGMIVLLLDTQLANDFDLEGQMCKNAIFGFVMMSAMANSIIKVYIEAVSSATDTVVYCYAMEQTRRRKVRSIALDEMIHMYYLGDAGKIPPGHRLERVACECPKNGKPGDTIAVEIEGTTYDVVIPPGARPGRDFEVAIPIPLNNLDENQEEEEDFDFEVEYDDSVESEENHGGAPAIRARTPPRGTGAADTYIVSEPSNPSNPGAGVTYVQQSRM
jgi:hypothetical protein